MTNAIPWMVGGCAIIGLVAAALFAWRVMKADPGDEEMQEISRGVQEGAMAFLSREYRWVGVFVVVLAIIIFFTLDKGYMVAMAYVAGSICSALAGLIGLTIATRANCRTAQAAKSGVGPALTVAFQSGAVMGLTVAGLGLLGLTVCYLIFEVWLGLYNAPEMILGFSLGASSIALFARVGGGIFTKAADVGADLVGKVEEGIPEDDPRNPAVIADNVGDNVGDVAGMGADLYESYVAAIIAPIAIASAGVVYRAVGSKAMLLPLALAGVGIICSIIGTLLVRTKEGSHLHQALSRGTYGTALMVTVAGFFLTWYLMGWQRIDIFYALLVGIAAGMGIGAISEYYTSDAYSPVKKIAKASETGAATTIIKGLATGMMSTLLPIIFVAIATGIAYWRGEAAIPGGGGIYAIGLTAIGMLATTGMVVSVDAYGPVADNAGGIAEMAKLDPEVREVTDSLDAVGNTTAAVAKGFAIGSAALAALALFSAYIKATGLGAQISLVDYRVIIGLFLGAMYPFFFSGLTMNAVGRAASSMIEEVRRQFRDIPGLREGKEGVKPNYAKCVDISTRTALREMVIPGLLTVLSPLLMGLWDTRALAGLLAGALVSGFVMAIFMANAGGAWDNAKKYIERGNLGGKGTPVHAAAVVGDTVGDPLKDTCGPSMNILIKVMTIVALVFVPLFL